MNCLILKPQQLKSEPCKFFLSGTCKKGLACNFAHVGVPHQNTKMQFVQQSGTGNNKNKVQVTVVQKSGTKGGSSAKQTKKAAYFVVDTSGSMNGTPAAAAADGFLFVKSRVLDDTDIISLYTFSDKTTACFQHQKRVKINDANVKRMIVSAAARGSCTALYDAIHMSIKDIPTNKKYTDQIKYVVVLTDGEDNHSSVTHSQCKQLIEKPGLANFYFILIGVGLNDTTKAVMQALCKPAHAHYVDSGSSPSEIKKAFVTVQKKIKEYTEILIRVRESGKVRPNGACAQVAQLLSNVQNIPMNSNKQLGQNRLLLLK